MELIGKNIGLKIARDLGIDLSFCTSIAAFHVADDQGPIALEVVVDGKKIPYETALTLSKPTYDELGRLLEAGAS
jgi:hypothetical protein